MIVVPKYYLAKSQMYVNISLYPKLNVITTIYLYRFHITSHKIHPFLLPHTIRWVSRVECRFVYRENTKNCLRSTSACSSRYLSVSDIISIAENRPLYFHAEFTITNIDYNCVIYCIGIYIAPLVVIIRTNPLSLSTTEKILHSEDNNKLSFLPVFGFSPDRWNRKDPTHLGCRRSIWPKQHPKIYR